MTSEKSSPVKELEPAELERVQAEREGWAVLVPAYSHVLPDVEAVLDMLQANGIRVIRFVGHSDIARLRCIMGTQVIQDQTMRRVLWLDSDQHLDPRDCVRLLLSRRKMITAVAPQRKLGGKLLIDFGADGAPESVALGDGGGEVRAYRCGFGAIAMDREVLEQVAEGLPLVTCDTSNFFPMFLPSVREEPELPSGWAYLGEDYAFCERAAEAGFQLFADTRIRVHHFGIHSFAWEDCLLPAKRFLTLQLDKTQKPEA